MPQVRSKFDDEYNRHLGQKLGLIEELRSELAEEKIECPGIVVVGAQSAGKSSVLQRLTGISFPRAENTCTRLPAIVSLQTDPSINGSRIYVSRDAAFRNPLECDSMAVLENRIMAMTMDLENSNFSVKNEPVYIRYIRKEGPVFSLIDLPGITYMDPKNQNFDIHEETVSMVRQYVSNPNTIILVVIPAVEDFSNAEALKIAMECDKEGNRTIGVVTKCDMVSESSYFLRKMRMTGPNDIKLKLGFVAVRNRGPGEENINIDEAERNMFSNHSLLKQLDPTQKGYVALTKKIVELQSELVDAFIPKTKKAVRDKIQKIETELESMGRVPETEREQRSILRSTLSSVQDTMTSLIRAEKVREKDYNVAARTYEKLIAFGSGINDDLPNYLGCHYKEVVARAVSESVGHTLPNFQADHPVLHDQVQKLLFNGLVEKNVGDLINQVKAYMLSVYERVLASTEAGQQYPKLQIALVEKVDEILRKARREALEVTNSLIVAESSNPFTQAADYLETIRKTRIVVQNIRNGHMNETQSPTEPSSSDGSGSESPRSVEFQPSELYNEVIAAGIDQDFLQRWAASESNSPEDGHYNLQLSIYMYVRVALRRLFDVIPMVVRDKLIYQVHKYFYRELSEDFDDHRRLNDLIQEKSNIREIRVTLKKRRDKLKDSLRRLELIAS
ncbi:Dynamin [Gracilaria domingensis]|nr:Dynamin [Gracilaria domingensis]